ncbi:hypothetical protein ATY38_04620 [Nitrosomonas ureae]|nr:hypothetical protein ATY38_04620 [Nitrosomonas ureae]
MFGIIERFILHDFFMEQYDPYNVEKYINLLSFQAVKNNHRQGISQIFVIFNKKHRNQISTS